MATDLADDSYDLSWFDDLPEDDQQAIAKPGVLILTGNDCFEIGLDHRIHGGL